MTCLGYVAVVVEIRSFVSSVCVFSDKCVLKYYSLQTLVIRKVETLCIRCAMYREVVWWVSSECGVDIG